MATKEITIQGLTVEVNQPYEAGHALTEAEAKALNQVRAENIGNNCRKAIKELADAEGSFSEEAAAEARKLVSEKDADYEFTLASVGSGRRVTDPLELECRRIARDYVNGLIKDKGMTLKAYKEENSEEKYDTLVSQVMENPEVVKIAKKNLADKNKLATAIEL